MSGSMKYWITQTATGELNKRYYVCDDSSTSTPTWMDSRQKSTKELVQGLITEKQKKMIKEEIKVWMDDHFQMAVKKEAKKILKDIENLKEEKTRLGKSISGLKQELRKTKKEIQEEVKNMEKILEEYSEKTMRFYNMDL